MRPCHLTLLGAVTLFAIPASPAAEVDLVHFVNQLTDLDRLPTLVDGETSKQFSSYDRNSRLGPNGEKLDWGANGDAGHYIRQDPSGEAVMAEMDGPGVITQTWSANPQGKLHFYIDDAKEPIVFDFTAFTTGGIPEIPAPISTKGGGAGCNCYLPIPYAKRCVIKADKKHGQYYHFDYTTFPPGTQVKSFRWPLSPEEKEAVAKAARWWAERCGEDPGPARSGQKEIATEVVVPPQGKVVLAELTGPAVITAFRAKLESAGRFASRSVLLRATWDGQATPSVEAPFGDFFASTWGDIPFRSLPIGMTENGGYSYWRMPFSKGAKFEAANDGKIEARLKVTIAYAPAEWTANTAYFHAKWRREAPNKTFDWPYLRCEGRGRFVGVAMSVQNPDPPWFGEGDEKVTVDGERFPSWFGTGTEDYFCDAWGFRKFIQPTHGCPIYNEPGKTTVYRWHTMDSIPFSKSFEITIENYGDNKDYSSVAYWYAVPPNQDFFKSPTLEERIPWTAKLPNCMEAEELAGTGAAIVNGETSGYELSADKALKIGDGGEVQISIPVEADGVYRLVLLGPKGQKGSGLNVRSSDGVILEAAAPAFGASGELAAPKRKVFAKGKAELVLKAVGPGSVLVDAVRIEPSRRHPGVIEAEDLPYKKAGRAQYLPAYALENDAVSGGAYVYMTSKRQNQWVELTLPDKFRGKFEVSAKFLKGPAGGSYEASVGASPLPTVIDGYAPEDTLSPEIVLGVADFPGGEGNAVRFTAQKRAEGSIGLDLAIDYLRLKRIIVPGAIEAEHLKILRQENANAQVQMLGQDWSAEGQLFCPGQKNQFVELELPAKEPGTYDLAIYFTKAGDYGILEAELDGKPIGERWNGVNNGIVTSGPVSFGKVTLSAGTHRLLFRCRDKDPNSSNYFMGIDCLTLTPEKK